MGECPSAYRVLWDIFPRSERAVDARRSTTMHIFLTPIVLDCPGDFLTWYQTYGWDGTLIKTLGQFYCLCTVHMFHLSKTLFYWFAGLRNAVPCRIHLNIFHDSPPVSMEHRAHRWVYVLDTVNIITHHVSCELVECYFLGTLIPTHSFRSKWRVDEPDHAGRRISKCPPSLRPIKSVKINTAYKIL